MNIDALSLLTAKDPGEIVDQFRDAMFATGKAYDDLNRHEKQLMQQAIDREASSSNEAANRQEFIDNVDSQIIILTGDIQFLSQQ